MHVDLFKQWPKSLETMQNPLDEYSTNGLDLVDFHPQSIEKRPFAGWLIAAAQFPKSYSLS